MQKSSSDSDPAQPEVLIIGKTSNPTPCTIRTRARSFGETMLKREDIIVVLEVLTKRIGKEQVLMPRSTATGKGNTSKPVNEKESKANDHPKG